MYICKHILTIYLTLITTTTIQVNPLAIDHVWFHDPWTSETVYIYPHCATVGGLVAIALRDINIDEELYMDYKYHKKNHPVWYTPVEYKE